MEQDEDEGEKIIKVSRKYGYFRGYPSRFPTRFFYLVLHEIFLKFSTRVYRNIY